MPIDVHCAYCGARPQGWCIMEDGEYSPSLHQARQVSADSENRRLRLAFVGEQQVDGKAKLDTLVRDNLRALQVPCPHCRVAVGQGCTPTESGLAHSKRREAALLAMTCIGCGKVFDTAVALEAHEEECY